MPSSKTGGAQPEAVPERTSAPESVTIQTDPVGSLFQRRWQQECDTSLILADENRKLNLLVRQQAALIEDLQKKNGEQS